MNVLKKGIFTVKFWHLLVVMVIFAGCATAVSIRVFNKRAYHFCSEKELGIERAGKLCFNHCAKYKFWNKDECKEKKYVDGKHFMRDIKDICKLSDHDKFSSAGWYAVPPEMIQ